MLLCTGGVLEEPRPGRLLRTAAGPSSSTPAATPAVRHHPGRLITLAYEELGVGSPCRPGGLTRARRRCSRRGAGAAERRLSREAVVRGRIEYPEPFRVDGGELSDKGTLIVAKAVLTPEDAVRLLTYALKETAFPRQSTGDQFFDHEQFDAYQALGHFIGTAALDEGAEVEEDEQPEPPAQPPLAPPPAGAEAGPAAVAVDPGDGAERLGEVGRGEPHALGLDLVEQPAAGRPGQVGLDVGARAPVGLADLRRMVGDVAPEQQRVVAGADQQALRAGGVPGGVDEAELGVQVRSPSSSSAIPSARSGPRSGRTPPWSPRAGPRRRPSRPAGPGSGPAGTAAGAARRPRRGSSRRGRGAGG